MSHLLSETVRQITPQDPHWRSLATARIQQLTMPHWALGRVLDLAVDLAGMTGTLSPRVERKTIVTMAGDHGVVAEGVSKYPQAVTVQMVHNFVGGGAGINVLARLAGAKVVVVDMGVAGDMSSLAGRIVSSPVGPGTRNMARGPAMTREEAIKALEVGIKLAHELTDESDLVGVGDMGIGNTTPSAAIGAVFTDKPVSLMTGRGTGLDDDQLRHKIGVIERALALNMPDHDDGLDVLSKVGGFEIGGIAGLILGIASRRKPVLIDGFIATAAALVAQSLSPASTQYMIAAHRSAEPGHRLMLEHLRLRPLLDLDLRLGEGTGAALAMNLVEASVRILGEMSTFEQAAVSKADK